MNESTSDIKGFQHEYRDRLFKAIFGRDTPQSKKWRLELYNALNNSNYTDPDALELNTIENVIYLTMRNNISFLVDSQMTLYEQQSTYNPNIRDFCSAKTRSSINFAIHGDSVNT